MTNYYKTLRNEHVMEPTERKTISATESVVLIPQLRSLILPLGHETGLLIRHIMSPLCKTCGITLQQLYLLCEIKDRPGMTVSELCSKSGVLTANFSVVFRKLERQGLAVRERSLKDRRASTLFLTPDGEALLNEIDAEWNNHVNALFFGATQEELACVLEGLQTLRTMLERVR